MTFEEAIKELSKHEPCPHHALNTDLGNGQVWARCDDCGQKIRQDSVEKLREENERFCEAVSLLSKRKTV